MDVLEVYGARDAVCKELGFKYISLQRSKWPFQGVRSLWADLRMDFLEGFESKKHGAALPFVSSW